MDTQDFQLLICLSRTRNITRAAKELYSTQSAISKRVQQLEKKLGFTLLLRSHQGIAFTPNGEIVLRYAKVIVAKLDDMQRELKEKQGIVSGTLRAGISVNYARYRLPSKLRLYEVRYPLVHTQLIVEASHRLFSMFVAGQIELAILRGEYSDWTGPRILLSKEPICIIKRKEDADIPLGDLTQIIRQADFEMDRDIALWRKEHGIHRTKNQIIANSTATCIEMVHQGLGWSIVPRICLDNFAGSIQPMKFANGKPLLRVTYLFYTKQAAVLPQVKAFIELITENAGTKKDPPQTK